MNCWCSSLIARMAATGSCYRVICSRSHNWDEAIEVALASPGMRWVVQRLANLPVNEFPVVDTEGKVHVEPFYTVMGFAPTKYGLASSAARRKSRWSTWPSAAACAAC